MRRMMTRCMLLPRMRGRIMCVFIIMPFNVTLGLPFSSLNHQWPIGIMVFLSELKYLSVPALRSLIAPSAPANVDTATPLY